MNMDMKTTVKNQIAESAANVQYTFIAHWNMVDRFEKKHKLIKILQIVLTAISTGGFLALLLEIAPSLSWLGALCAALSLALNLYTYRFNLQDDINKHTQAANELWEIREKYKFILSDFENLDENEIRQKRDMLMEAVSHINKSFPGTDKKSFIYAQKHFSDYKYEKGEAGRAINLDDVDT